MTLILSRAAKSVINASSTKNLLKSLSTSAWDKFPLGPPDPIIGLNEAYAKDTFEQKVNVGVGAYRDDNGKPHVLQCVRDAEDIILKSNLDHEYSGIVSMCFILQHFLT